MGVIAGSIKSLDDGSVLDVLREVRDLLREIKSNGDVMRDVKRNTDAIVYDMGIILKSAKVEKVDANGEHEFNVDNVSYW